MIDYRLADVVASPGYRRRAKEWDPKGWDNTEWEECVEEFRASRKKKLTTA